jgi:phage tail sheath gpL-like
MTITFDGLPGSIRKPGVYSEFNLRMGRVGLPGVADKIVLIAQMLSAGSYAALTPYKAFSDSDVALGSGSGSIAHLTARAMYEANPYIDLTVIGVADAVGSAAATGTITLTGTATGAGYAWGRIGNVKAQVSYSTGDLAADVASALKDAIAAKANILPATVAVAGTVITATARNKGTCGNYIRLQCGTTGAGITAEAVAMAGGSGDPEFDAVGGVLEKLYPGDYTLYVSALSDSDNLQALRDHITEVSGGREQRPAIGVFGYNDLVGNLAAVETLCADDLNDWRMSCAYLPKTNSSPWEIAGAYAAALASIAHANANWDDVPLTGIHAPEVADRLSVDIQEELLNSGVTPLHVIPGEKVAIVRAITTYVTDSTGTDDPRLLDLAKPRALDYTRKACNQRVALKFKNVRKTDVRKNLMMDEILDVLGLLEEEEVVRDVEKWKDYILIEDDPVEEGRWNVRIPAPIVPGLHVIAQRFDLL